ncbi:MAG: hypothetical protein RPS47_01885 [Colwellia sp.]
MQNVTEPGNNAKHHKLCPYVQRAASVEYINEINLGNLLQLSPVDKAKQLTN